MVVSTPIVSSSSRADRPRLVPNPPLTAQDDANRERPRAAPPPGARRSGDLIHRGSSFASAVRTTGAITAPLARRAPLASRALAPHAGSSSPASLASIARSARSASTFLAEYDAHVAERAAQNIAPKPLDAKQVAALCEQLESPPAGDEAILMDLFENRVPPGSTRPPTSRHRGSRRSWRARRDRPCGRGQGCADLGHHAGRLQHRAPDSGARRPGARPLAADQLSGTLLVFDAFHDVEAKAKAGTNTPPG